MAGQKEIAFSQRFSPSACDGELQKTNDHHWLIRNWLRDEGRLSVQITNEEPVIPKFSKVPLKTLVLRMVTHKSLKEAKTRLSLEVPEGSLTLALRLAQVGYNCGGRLT